MRLPLILAGTALALSAVSTTAAAQQRQLPTIAEYLSPSRQAIQSHRSDVDARLGQIEQAINARGQGMDPRVEGLMGRIARLERTLANLSVSAGGADVDIEALINARIDALDTELSEILGKMASHYNARLDRVDPSGQGMQPPASFAAAQPSYAATGSYRPQAAAASYSSAGNNSSMQRVLSRTPISVEGQNCKMVKGVDFQGYVISKVSCQAT